MYKTDTLHILYGDEIEEFVSLAKVCFSMLPGRCELRKFKDGCIFSSNEMERKCTFLDAQAHNILEALQGYSFTSIHISASAKQVLKQDEVEAIMMRLHTQ